MSNPVPFFIDSMGEQMVDCNIRPWAEVCLESRSLTKEQASKEQASKEQLAISRIQPWKNRGKGLRQPFDSPFELRLSLGFQQKLYGGWGSG